MQNKENYAVMCMYCHSILTKKEQRNTEFHMCTFDFVRLNEK